MKILTTRVVAGLGFTGVTGTVLAGVWYINKPKDVRSKLVSEGLTLVGSSGRAWRAVFLTHKEDSEFISFAGILASDSDKVAGSKASSACKRVLGVAVGAEGYDSSLDKARKYCTAPTFKTVEAKVLFSDKEIASEDRDWKNLFTIHKGDASFIDKVKKANNSDNSFTNSIDAETAKTKVQKFCNDLKVKKPEKENVSDYEKYCLQTPPNARSFYEQQGSKFVGEGAWGNKFDSIKGEDTTLFEAIKDTKTLTSDSLSTEGAPQLKAWCDKEVNKEISEITDSQKLKSRCFN